MTLATLCAHCGACSAPMTLTIDPDGYRFVCHTCGHETIARLTIQEADNDVVWAEVGHAPRARPSRRRQEAPAPTEAI